MKKTILLIFVLLMFPLCKRKDILAPAPFAISLLSFGEIKKGDTLFKRKDRLQYKEKLSFSPQSFCELQIQGEDWIFRIKGKAEFELAEMFKLEEEQRWSFDLKEGTLVAKIGRKLKPRESLQITTPSLVIGVRGTSFSVAVAQDGNTKIQVLEGKLAVQFPKTTGNAKEIFLETKEAILLDKKLIEKLNATHKEEEFNLLFKDIEEKQIQRITEKEIANLEAELQTLNPIAASVFQNPEELDKVIDQKIQERQAELLQKIEETTGLKRGKITLTNGQEIIGIIQHSNGKFTVDTPTGRREFLESEVLEED